MKKLWLIFAQTTTIGLAAWFLVSALRPDWVSRPAPAIATVKEVVASAPAALPSYRAAVKRAMPAVVNIYTAKEIRQRRSLLFNDPIFRRFFGDEPAQKASSLGSGVIVSDKGYIVTNNHVVELFGSYFCKLGSVVTNADEARRVLRSR